MSRVPQAVFDPEDPKAIAEHLSRVQRVVDGRLEFGSPQDPADPTSTIRALGVAHNGTLQNVDGSWFEAVLEATGLTTVTCIHNLNVAITQPATAPNVRWLRFGVMHNGTGAIAATISVDVWFQGAPAPYPADAANGINLVFNLVVGGVLTVNAANPVVVSLLREGCPMNYRFATAGPDLSAYDELLRRYLMEDHKAGSPVRMTRRTLDFYRDLARGYLIGSDAGVLVFAQEDTAVGPQPQGFTLAGGSPFFPWIDTEHGKTATVWISWVEPRFREKGIGLAMLAFGEPQLLELGFEIAAMSVREENASGQALSLAFGAKPIERFYHYTLGGTLHGRR